MKKIFNYALLAAALLVGVNVNAEDVAQIGSTKYATLQAAIDAAQNDQTIILIADKDIATEAVTFFKAQTDVVTLDLNGRTIKFPAVKSQYNFRVVRGTLKVTGQGKVTNVDEAAANPSEAVFGVFGFWGTVEKGEVYSKLIIDEDVEIIGGKNGICVMEMTASNVLGSAQANLDAFGYRNTIVFVSSTKATSAVASGAHVEVNGTVNAQKYGIKINGTISRPDAKEGFDTNAPTKGNGPTDEYTKWQDYGDLQKYIDCAPYVTVGSTGHVVASATAAEATAIYSSGYGHWLIKGTCEGSTGVYIKSGTVRIEDATITSTSTNPWEEPGKDKGSGIDAGGSAIVIESQDGYPGATDVTIAGDSKISAASGYAIESATTSQDSKVNTITIEGGTFNGGTQGGVSFDQQDKDKVDIEGGSYDKNDVSDYVNGEGSYMTEVKNPDGSTTIVVGNDPNRPKEDGTEDADWNKEQLPASQSYLMWDLETTNQTLGTVETPDEATVGEFKMNAGTLTIEKGSKLTVKKLVMGAKAHIIVKVGATLIVNGEQGIVANATDNITIQAQEGNMGKFLFNPAVTSNRHPVATVTLYSKAWRVSADNRLTQYFGNPMMPGTITNIVPSSTSEDDWAKFSVWENNDWRKIVTLNYDPQPYNFEGFNKAFGLYSIVSNNGKNDLMHFDITGELVGNIQPEKLVIYGWTTTTNSWLGNMDGDAIYNELFALYQAGHTDLEGAIYTYNQQNNTLTWEAMDGDARGSIEPLQPIMFHNLGAKITTNVMNYKALVWDKAVPSSANAPAKKVYNNSKVAIHVTAENNVSDRVIMWEGAEFSSANDFGYDASKYMNEEVCLYVNADKQYDLFASDNIENTFIGFNCAKAGKYTISFDKLRGENFALIDTKTNARIEMSEGATYEFLADAGEDAYRFQIVASAKAPTDMQKTNAAVKAIRALINGQIVISNGERFYNVLGAEVK